MNNKLKHVQLFEEFVSIQIENSDVHIHLNGEEETSSMSNDGVPPLSDMSTAKPGDDVIVDLPLMKLNPESTDTEDVKESDDFNQDEKDSVEPDEEDLNNEVEGD